MGTKRIYFDYNASAPLAPGLAAKISEWLEADPKNPNSAHQDGQRSKTLMEDARKTHARLLHLAPKDKLIFNSGGTEANNTVLHSAYHGRGAKKAILLTRVEHSCVYNYAARLSERGVELRFVNVTPDGQIDWADYQKKLDADVFLVSVMLAQNETGFVFPIQEMAALARSRGVPFHTDAVCALGKMPVNFADLGVDFLTFSSHKFGGLKGVGGIVVRADAKLSPYIWGGPQEGEKRAGTQNVIGIASSAFALEASYQNLAEKMACCTEARALLKAAILRQYPAVRFLESRQCLPQTLSAAFAGLSGNLLLTNLDLENVSVSYGSACASGSLEVSRVIRELGLPLPEAVSVLRLSFGPTLDQNGVTDFEERLKRVLQRMRAA